MIPRVHVLTDPARAAADWVIDRVETSIARTGRCRLGLSGGRAPVPLLRRLAEALPAELYPGLQVTWVDERHVPLGHADSNYHLAHTHWFAHAPAPVCTLPLWRGGDLVADRDAYAQAFAARYDSGLDVAVLGVGADGHVASLFPGDPKGLDAPGAVAAISDAPKPPAHRLTLTLPVISATPHLALLTGGSAKAPALRAGYARQPDSPLGRLTPHHEWVWFVDAEAAALLPPRPNAKGDPT